MRDRVLHELELAPAWKLRSRAAAASPASASAAEDIRQAGWDALRQEVTGCTRCPLYESRIQGVLGSGDIHADWLFVGEAPGAEEDRQGEPFVGAAGKLLDNMLASICLQRNEKVYITNILKSRPPENRNPKPEEIAACLPYLVRQVQLIQPQLIVALGRFAAHSLLDSDASIGSLRGRVHRYAGIPLIVTYHPAYLLRNLTDKARAWEDLCLARATMQDLLKRQPAPI